MIHKITNPAGLNGGAWSSKNVRLAGEHDEHKTNAAATQESHRTPHSVGIGGYDGRDIAQGNASTAKSSSFFPENAEKWR